jgi:hypothetical protein
MAVSIQRAFTIVEADHAFKGATFLHPQCDVFRT